METELNKLVAALCTSASVLQGALNDENVPNFRSDDPSPHPWDGGVPPPSAWYARKALVGLCYQIIALVQDPLERSIIDFTSFSLASSMNAVVRTQPTVAEVVLASGSDGIAVKDLAKNTGLDETKLYSLMHLLCTWNYFKEIEGGHISATRSTRALLPDSFVHGLSDSIIAGTAAASMLWEAAKTPSGSQHPSPFSLYHHVEIYDWIKARPDQIERFGRAMDTAEKTLDPGFILDLPVQDLGPNITLVDIGSGVGGLPMQLLKRNPGWKAVLQDQEILIPQMESFWKKDAPEIVESGRVTFLGHSFFEPTPLPPAPKDSPYVFMIKSVLHNWPDDLAAKILENLLPAAPPGTVLMIVNYTPAEPEPSKTTVEEFFRRINKHSMAEIQKAKIPLPDLLGVGWGFGDASVSTADMLMMLLMGSQCRTVTALKALLETTSWKFEGRTDYRGTTSVIKARRV
ncbi:S-adenosyl-L-methionine-dependent methyltransferase [Dacryopinax primogenitus]|uniref:S-adenosyl-L-methionine-dependent methyltransferase n=1 Tax=Dacryopinax primogenitus (strain DJM 731) TaxID=1858805 RepID=M5FUT1_DACPD|nr:S-adenosyl-L-methionine-dependent methyltransferase [Dacryopinax primogenitus]EJU00014.1 S-adenosyl-L-methionine-dependent methyltransferase [Dacryopinax primogenitus]